MSRAFYVEGLIFGILRCVATDIKMLRSKFLAKMVSAKFAYQNTGPVCHILILSIYIFATYIYKEQICPFFLFKKSSNAFIFMYVIRCLRKEGCSQAEVDHLFSSIVLPNITYALSVYGTSEAELTIAQQFLDRCFKRRYICRKLEIGELLKVQDHFT